MKKETCDTCKFSKMFSTTLLACRINPPVGQFDRTNHYCGHWPCVFVDDWCGKHEAKITKPIPTCRLNQKKEGE